MPQLRRLYDHTLYGALGGLAGWLLFGELVDKDWPWWWAALIGGSLIGAALGGLLLGLEPLLDRTWRRGARFMAFGILLGVIGGAAGFWVGEAVHYSLLPSADAPPVLRIVGALLDRALGWMLFGLAVGVAEGLAMRSWRKIGYGAVGGTLGGLVGGSLFGLLMALFSPGETAYLWGQMLGLVTLGGMIGLLTALVEDLLRPGSLRVLRGWREGREFPLLKTETLLGRDESADVLLLGDRQVARRHARIRQVGDRYILERLDGPPEFTLRNHEPVLDRADLQDGDRLQFGQTVLRFSRRITPERQRAPGTVLSASPA